LKRVLVIGGYGNFGCFITRRLAQENDLHIIIAGRSLRKAQALAQEVGGEAFQLDIHKPLLKVLAILKPDIVIHTSGPFQSQGYDVARACIDYGAHYIDLADGREFVAGIEELDSKAKAANVLIVSGASSVPCLTAALVDHFRSDFGSLENLDYGITTAQKTARGVATTAAILSYTGKAFKTQVNGKAQNIYGWQSLRVRKFPALGWRLLGNCNVPDLAIFPRIYPELRSIRFYAGLELPFIHVTLWLLSWLVRIGLIRQLDGAAPLLLRLSFMFDWLGTANSGFYMSLSGKDLSGAPKHIGFELTAKSGDGPYIPCMPVILLCKKLARGETTNTGAQACIGLISRDEYLDALNSLDITWSET
jgi:saccharopine dehydrogenase-like NADP-dependent oxidoreductase